MEKDFDLIFSKIPMKVYAEEITAMDYINGFIYFGTRSGTVFK